MTDSSGISQFQIDRLTSVWSIVEARKSLPAMIVVTSATPTDDTQSIARGLAQVAHDAGQRTGYLRLAAQRKGGTPPVPYSELSIAPRGSQREAFDAAAASWLTMYDAVIVDAATFGSEALAAHAARLAEGVVVAVCDQRRVFPADRELARLLGELGADVIGVVMTAPMNKVGKPILSRNRLRLEIASQP